MNKNKSTKKINWFMVFMYTIASVAATILNNKLKPESITQTLIIFGGCFLIAFIILVIFSVIFKKNQ
jgi:uncharacterized membrane protein (DUF485 family)